MQNKEELKKTLIEVRKAYRLLYSYQRGILNLMEYIGKYLKFRFDIIEPRFSRPSNYKELKKSAWDWLNLYYCAFHFSKEILDKKTIYLSIFLVTDTGFLNNLESKSTNFIDKLDNFTEEDKSESKIIFLIGYEREKRISINEVYFSRDRNFLLEGNKNNREYKSQNQQESIFYKHYNLEDFLDEEEAKSQLEDFISFCKKNNIDLELQDKV